MPIKPLGAQGPQQSPGAVAQRILWVEGARGGPKYQRLSINLLKNRSGLSDTPLADGQANLYLFFYMVRATLLNVAIMSDTFGKHTVNWQPSLLVNS